MKHTGIIILAAGNSSRMGRAKQQLSYQGKTLLKRIVDHALEHPAHRIAVVLGATQGIDNGLPGDEHRMLTVVNESWTSGMASSIVAGLKTLLAAYPEMDRCIISVCDQPMITASVFDGLKELAEKTGKNIVATGYSGTHGVPVLFEKKFFGELLQLGGTNGAKELIRRYHDDVAILPYEAAKLDVDTFSDYAGLTHEMVSVDEARMLIDFHLPKPTVEHAHPTNEALGYTLAADITAPRSIPAFAQSSMDGYAIRYADRDRELPVAGTIPAGDSVEKEIPPGQAMRIFTGAPIPKGADTVVMQEKVSLGPLGTVTINDSGLAAGANVRPVGSEVMKGATVMQAGTYLTPAAVGYLAGTGCAQVDVIRRPRVSLMVTGDELRPLGSELNFGEVYESNSVQLKAALALYGIEVEENLHVRDNVEQLKSTMQRTLAKTDILLLVGGVSVGDYDFVVKVAADCGVQQRFHRIRQKPGKPLFFGTLGEKLVFGLPGNPSSALTCFYLYVAPALEKLMKVPPKVKQVKAVLSSDCKKNPGLTHFLKAWYDGVTVTPLHAQESYRLQSYALANSLLILDETSEGCRKGEEVEIVVLPS